MQGLEQAPLVVKKCHASWLRHNPDWNIIFLDENNLENYISLNSRNITKAALCDILRVNLLALYGGVWADATCFCTKPLNNWIYNYIGNGFFAFEKPGPDRTISSWFIAAYTNCYIVNSYQKAVNNYWEDNPRLVFFESSPWHFLNRYIRKLGPQVWFSKFILKVLKVYPYFWFHYLFEHIYLKDKQFRESWDGIPKISADIRHKLQHAGLFSPLTEEVKEAIDNKISPVYKLTWKYDPAGYKKGTIFHYLLNHEV